MSHLNKGKANYILVLALLLSLFTITLYCTASGFSGDDFHSFLTVDTIPLNSVSSIQISKSDSLKNKNNTTGNKNIASAQKGDTNIIVVVERASDPGEPRDPCTRPSRRQRGASAAGECRDRTRARGGSAVQRQASRSQ